LSRRLAGPRASLEVLEKKKNLLPLSRFEPRTDQPVQTDTPADARYSYFCLLQGAHNFSEAYIASFAMDSGGYFEGG
jgi:hypothetical protein